MRRHLLPSLVALAASCSTALASPAADGRPAPFTCVRLGAEPQQSHSFKSEEAPQPALLPLRSIAWDLRARGSQVEGTLTATFEPHDGRAPLPALLGIRPAAGLRVVGVAAEADGQPLPLQQWAPPDAPGPDSGRRARRPATAEPAPSPSRLHRTTLPPGARVSATFEVEVEAPLSAGAFRLELAPTRDDCDARGQRPIDLAFSLGFDAVGEVVVLPDGVPATSWEGEGDGDGKARLLRLAEDAVADAAAGPIRVAWTLEGGDDTEARAWTRRRADGARELSVLVTAPRSPDEALVRDRDVAFVVDVSGSMAKDGKLEFAKQALLAALGSLRERDTVDAIAFSGEWSAALDAPAPRDDSRGRLEAWVGSLRAMGGTRLAPALGAALQRGTGAAGHRLVVVLSDGIVGDERDVLDLLETSAGDARLLLVSIGSDANVEALRRMAERGRGEAVTVAGASGIVPALESLMRSFASPVAWDVEIDWGVPVRDVRPSRVPDLHAGRPVAVRAIVDANAELPDVLRVRGSTRRGALELEVRREEE